MKHIGKIISLDYTGSDGVHYRHKFNKSDIADLFTDSNRVCFIAKFTDRGIENMKKIKRNPKDESEIFIGSLMFYPNETAIGTAERFLEEHFEEKRKLKNLRPIDQNYSIFSFELINGAGTKYFMKKSKNEWKFFRKKEGIKRNPKDVEYQEIVFLQGDEADEALNILDESGTKAALDYLGQYDTGEYRTTKKQPWGSSDKIFKSGNLVMSYNTRIGYIRLSRVIESNPKKRKSMSLAERKAWGKKMKALREAKRKNPRPQKPKRSTMFSKSRHGKHDNSNILSEKRIQKADSTGLEIYEQKIRVKKFPGFNDSPVITLKRFVLKKKGGYIIREPFTTKSNAQKYRRYIRKMNKMPDQND